MDPDEALLLQLLERAASADEPAVREEARRVADALFLANEQRLYRACRRYLGDPEAAREMTHEVLITAYHRLGHFRGESSFFSFLYGIARFKCMNALRRKREVLAEDGVADGVDPAMGAVTGIRREERLAALREAAAAVLDPLEQEALHLRYEEGLGQDEIGRILGVSGSSGGRALLQRCRRKLDAELRRRAESRGEGESWLLVTR